MTEPSGEDFSVWAQESEEWAALTAQLFDEWLDQAEPVEVVTREDRDRLP